MSRFRAFVMLAGMRTGSNRLQDALNALDGVECLGELFNPGFIGQHNRFALAGIDIDARDAAPFPLLDHVVARPGMAGFRLFHDHDPRILEAVLRDPSIAKIVLGRNPVDAYVSLRIAQETGQWRLTNPRMARTARPAFEPEGFDAVREAQSAFRARINRALQTTGQTGFWLDYADTGDPDVVNGIAAFLGVDARLETLPGRLKRQNPGEAAEKVANPDAMAAHLARLGPAGMSALPEAEAPSGLPVRRIIAAGTVLALPMPGGPTAAVRTWLKGVGDVAEGMTAAELRRWMRRNPGFHAVTVVAHPLERARRVFRHEVLGHRGGPVRRLLVRHYEAPMSETGEIRGDDGARRDCLIAFLHFVRANLGGQTALPPDPRWGHQVTALRAMADHLPPMRVIREDEARRELTRLAPDAPLWPSDAEEVDGSADKELEELARQVWRRDYLALGFRSRPDRAGQAASEARPSVSRV